MLNAVKLANKRSKREARRKAAAAAHRRENFVSFRARKLRERRKHHTPGNGENRRGNNDADA